MVMPDLNPKAALRLAGGLVPNVNGAKNRKSIVYFGQTPGQGTGSPINMLRHLRRLASAGWDVSIVSQWGEKTNSCDAEGWKVLQLPHRRAWWPPYRQGSRILRKVRMILWARECRSLFRGHKPDAVLTYLSYHCELMSEVAAHYCRLEHIPMTVIIYDDALAFGKHTSYEAKMILGRFRWILRQSHQNWFVSHQLASAYGFRPSEDSVELPMPDGDVELIQWREEFSDAPIVVYAGYIYPQQYPLLARLAGLIQRAGGKLLLISKDSPETRAFADASRVEFHPLLPTNRDALEFVRNRAAAFLAAYCDDVVEMPWIRSSYPSKVVEFGNLGLPILFVSPAESAIFAWNQERGVPFNLLPDDSEGVLRFIEAIKRQLQWNALAKPIRELARTEFNPERIQQRIEYNLLRK